MKISDILSKDTANVSFEVFPPKKAANFEEVKIATEKVASLSPSFISVTYGAGGGTSDFTLEIAKNIEEKYKVTVLPHLTCVSNSKLRIREELRKMKALGFQNIMALRGDIPEDGRISGEYQHAIELIRDIKEFSDDFCIGGACYPEGHIECPHKDLDIDHIKEKVSAGLDFLTTQMFFDNAVFFNYLYRLRDKGINIPVIAGIMPITRKSQLKRSVSLSGTSVPPRFREIVDKFGDSPEAMKAAGIIYASEQITDLLSNNARHIHIYTMNRPDVAEGILKNIRPLLDTGTGISC